MHYFCNKLEFRTTFSTYQISIVKLNAVIENLNKNKNKIINMYNRFSKLFKYSR